MYGCIVDDDEVRHKMVTRISIVIIKQKVESESEKFYERGDADTHLSDGKYEVRRNEIHGIQEVTPKKSTSAARLGILMIAGRSSCADNVVW